MGFFLVSWQTAVSVLCRFFFSLSLFSNLMQFTADLQNSDLATSRLEDISRQRQFQLHFQAPPLQLQS